MFRGALSGVLEGELYTPSNEGPKRATAQEVAEAQRDPVASPNCGDVEHPRFLVRMLPTRSVTRT